MHEHLLTGIVALIAIGAFAQWLAWQLKLPSILLLLAAGFLVGPVAGWLDPDAIFGELLFPFVSLAAAVVLFEGGLTASWEEIRGVATPVRRLVTWGLLITWVFIATAAHLCLGLHAELALLLGAILVVTGPTVIGPLLRHARPHGQVGSVLKLEGILNDPFGAVLAVLVFQVIQAEQTGQAVSLIAAGVVKALVVSAGIGLGVAFLFVALRSKNLIPESLHNAVILPMALGCYALANEVQGESGLLAVTVMGIALASQKRVSIEPSVEFAEHARTLLISILFIVLTARMDLRDVTALPLGTVAFVAIAILIVRPVSVWFSTIGTDLSNQERAYISSIAPRGVVAAAVSSVFALRLVDIGYESATLLMPVTFALIAISVAISGLAAKPLAQALGLGQEDPHGVLFFGAHPVARTIAQVLSANRLRVVLVDPNPAHAAAAKKLGLRAFRGYILSKFVLNRLDLDGIGHFVAFSSRDDQNTFVVSHFQRLFGKERTYQVHLTSKSSDPRRGHASEFRGQIFADGTALEHLTHMFEEGARAQSVSLTDEFDYADLRRQHDEEIVPLFALSKNNALRLLGGDHEPPASGESLIYFGFTPERTRRDSGVPSATTQAKSSPD